MAAGILLRDEQVLIAQRPSGKHGAGFWEFPGGKIEPQESAASALIRELNEELGVVADDVSPFLSLTHDYAERRVHLEFLLVERWTGTPCAREGQAIEWVDRRRLNDFAFLPANEAVVKQLLKR